jgi:electron transfer flavoprotein alpha subunit
MSTLVYINSNNGIGKASLEVVSYAKKLGNDVIVVANGNGDDAALASLGEYGASKVMIDRSVGNDPQQITRLISSAVDAIDADTVVFSHDLTAKAVAPRLSVRMKAGLVSGAVAVPEGGTVKVNVFSGKAFGHVKINTEKKNYFIASKQCSTRK